MVLSFKLKSRYIVAFSYNRSKLRFDQLADRADSGSSWELESQSRREKDIYNYIDDSFLNKDNIENRDVDKAIGCKYVLHTNKALIYRRGAEEINFNINDLHLVLFQTGIGFLWYEISFRNKNLSASELIDFNYYFKELARNRNNNYIFVEGKPRNLNEGEECPATSRKIGKGKVIDKISFSLGGWFGELLSDLDCDITFYPFRNSAGANPVPDKAILFHHLSTNNKDKIVEYAYYLTRGYKDSYNMPLNIEDKMYKPFKNVYFYATSEGCGYYGLADIYNENFFNNSTKVIGDYFEMFLLLLYQSYTLVLCSEKISTGISGNVDDYTKYNDNQIEELDRISTELNVFLAKSVYSSVSHIQHQNDFYEYVSSTFRIRENIESVSAGIESLRNLENNLMEEEKEKQQKALEMGVTIISVLAIFAAYNDAKEFVINILPGFLSGIWLAAAVWLVRIILIVVTVVVAFLVGKYLLGIIRNYRSNKNRKK